ncbi:MAG: hypothetical protein JXK05_04900 [Campylobacterales bacterium]|nr:hypothetical protein [Campylobacterales bacterium]
MNLQWRNKLIHIVPMPQSYFERVSLPSAKLDPSMLQLNFAHLSPYPHFSILARHTSDALLLWFTPSAQPTQLLSIPESYLLYRALRAQHREGIFIYRTDPLRVLVIQQGELHTAFTAKALSAYERHALQERYRAALFDLESSAAADDAQQLLRTLPLVELGRWYQPATPFQTTLKHHLYKLVIPTATAFLLLIAIEYAHDRYLDHRISTLETRYLALKKQNDPYRDAQNTLANSEQFISDFAAHALIYPHAFEVTAVLMDLLASTQTTATSLTLSGGRLELHVSTEHSITLLERALQSGYFDTFKIVSKHPSKTKGEQVHFQATLKPLKEPS